MEQWPYGNQAAENMASSPITTAVATLPVPSGCLLNSRMETPSSLNTSVFQLLFYGCQWHVGCSSGVAYLVISCMFVIRAYATCTWSVLSLQNFYGPAQVGSPTLHSSGKSDYLYRIFTAQISLQLSSTVSKSCSGA